MKPGDVVVIGAFGEVPEHWFQVEEVLDACITGVALTGPFCRGVRGAGVACGGQGARLDTITIAPNEDGYRRLDAWANGLGHVTAFGIDGTGSYGAGMSRDLQARGHTMLDVMRPNRQLRYLHGKSDCLDAEGAARFVLNGQATATAKSQGGTSEMNRHLKVARDSAVKAKSQAMITLKTLIINAPAELRSSLEHVRGPISLVRHLTALRPVEIISPMSPAKSALRSIARRWLALHEEIQQHDEELERMVAEKAPDLIQAHGISSSTVAEMLTLVGDNPERIRSEAALAKLCGVCPIPASSGKTVRMRLNRGGNRQANAALYRVAIVRMQDHTETKRCAARRTAEGKTRREIVRCIKRYIVREIFRALCRSKLPTLPP